uniref:Uncharacterized protein n=1 Tax=Citrifermentans bremense TaxID=60035 RepID=A0A6S6LWY2_9BACT
MARRSELLAMKLEKVKLKNCSSRTIFPLKPPTAEGSYSQMRPVEKGLFELDSVIA